MDSKEISQSVSLEEYYASLLGATLGMCLLASSLNLVMIYISLELTSISSYILTASMRESRHSSEAGLPLPRSIATGRGEEVTLHLSLLGKGLLISLLVLTILFGLWPTPLMELTKF